MTISLSPHSVEPSTFVLPDLVSHCHFPLTYHPDGDAVAAASLHWIISSCPHFSEKKVKALNGLQAGELTAYCYHDCPPERLRVVSDFMYYLFHLDDISDGMMRSGTRELADCVMNALWFPESYRPTAGQPEEELSPGKLARDYWRRCIESAAPGVQERFKESFQAFFEAVYVQAQDRDAGVMPDLQEYIAVRRDTSGCRPVFDLLEYALGIELPWEVVEHPVMRALNQGTNDLVTWSNDIFSYNKEQARGDTHNMISILMAQHGLTLQQAVDHVGDLCEQTIDTFVSDSQCIPSWGPEVDKMVQLYVAGLRDWIVGSLHWSFMTTRYFATEGNEVKKSRFVQLMPPKANGY